MTWPSWLAPDPWGRLRDGALVALAVLACWWHAVALRDWVFEDAYITFRYAANVAAGNGFVFNLGERVLGTTTPLFTLLLAGFGALGFDVPLAGKVVSVVSLSVLALEGAWILRRFQAPNLGALFALFVLWGSGQILALTGMETTFLTALLLAALIAALQGRPKTTGVLLGLACLTRYDAALFAVALGLALWIRDRRPPWTTTWITVAVAAPWLAFSQLYFGSVLPNTLDAKTAMTPPLEYLTGSLARASRYFFSPAYRYVSQNEVSGQLQVLVFLVLGAPLLLYLARLLRRDRILLTVVLYPVLLWAGYTWIGPGLPFRWYLLPATYVLVLACLLAWGVAVEHVRFRPWAAVASLVLLVASAAALPAGIREEIDGYCNEFYQGRVGAYATLAWKVRETGLEDLRLLVNEPGYLASLIRNPIIDGAGLVTPGLRFPGPDRTPIEEVIEKHQPELSIQGEVSPDWRRIRGFRSLYRSSVKELFVRRDLYEERAADLAADWIRTDFPYPEAVELGHPIAIDFESADDDPERGFHGWWGAATLVGPVPGLRRGKEDVTDDVLTTHGGLTRSKTVIITSPPFRIDFDELTFEIAASASHKYLAAELLVNGLPVHALSGSELKPGKMTAVRWPVTWWRGKVGVLRFVDRGADEYLAADRIASRQWQNLEVFDDFDSGEFDERWQQVFAGGPESYVTVAKRLGISDVLGKASALSLGRDGDQRLVSRPFVVDHDRIAFQVFDFGAQNMQVHLLVDDRPVRVFRGRRSNRLVDVEWNVTKFRGQQAVFEVVDGNPGPAWIGVDGIVFYDP